MLEQWEALLDALESGEDAQVDSLAFKLATQGGEILPFLWEALTGPSEDVRWAALRVLAEMDAPPIEWFIWMLADRSPLIRQAAALGLVRHPHSRALPALVEALADPDPLAADLAMRALIAQGERAAPVLLQVAEELPPAARIRAVRALAAIKDVRAIPYFMQLVEQGSMLTAYWAAQGLENLGQDMVYYFPGR